MRQKERREGKKTQDWQASFEEHLGIWSHLPSVSERLSELGFMQSLHSIIRCIRSEEEDFARRELKRVLASSSEIEEQVGMNSKVLKQCLKAISESLIESVWEEELGSNSVQIRESKLSEIQKANHHHHQSRDSSESLPPKKKEDHRRIHPGNHEFESKGGKVAFPSTSAHQKSSTRGSMITSQQIRPTSRHIDEPSDNIEDFRHQSERSNKVHSELSTSKRALFKSPQASNKQLQKEASSSRFTSPKTEIAKSKHIGSSAREPDSKAVPSKQFNKAKEKDSAKLQKQDIKKQPQVIESKAGRGSEVEPNRTSKSKGMQRKSQQPKQFSESHLNEPASPLSGVEAEGAHREPPLDPISPPRPSEDSEDYRRELVNSEDLPKDDLFAKKLAMSVKKKLLGNTAPLDVHYN